VGDARDLGEATDATMIHLHNMCLNFTVQSCLMSFALHCGDDKHSERQKKKMNHIFANFEHGNYVMESTKLVTLKNNGEQMRLKMKQSWEK